MLNIVSRFAHQLIAPKAVTRVKYNTFKELLQHDRHCHEQLAELEELYYRNRKIDIHHAGRLHRELSDGVSAMVACLSRMAPASHLSLRAYYKKIDFYGRIALTPLPFSGSGPFILGLDTPYENDFQTGGKGLHLSQIRNRLGLPVPDGFLISTSAFNYFIEENDLRGKINAFLSQVDITSTESLYRSSESLIRLISTAGIPVKLRKKIRSALESLSELRGCHHFAVRSSAVGEDSALSFAGQYDSVLNVGKDNILSAYKKILASKYSPRSLFYRISNGLLDEDTPMAILVLEMVDALTSGVVTTNISGEGKFTGVVIHSTDGLGDQLMGGKLAPLTTMVTHHGDEFIIEPPPPPSVSLMENEPCRANEASHLHSRPNKQQALQLADWAYKISLFYQSPQEIEWSLDGKGNLLLLQARSMHVQETKETVNLPDISIFPVLIKTAEQASHGAGCGPVFVIENENQLADVPQGAVLVTTVTPPSYIPILDRVCAVVADLGSAADHFSSVAREFGVPVLVKTGNGSTILTPGQTVTVWSDGGIVFDGCITPIIESCPTQQKTATESPFHQAFAKAASFIFPLKLINPTDPSFTPENCRSLHDIIRYVHEKALLAMFDQAGRRSSKKREHFLLETSLPLALYILDVGGGTSHVNEESNKLNENNLLSVPLKSLLKGLTHPGVNWGQHAHFDWKNFSEIIMGDGIVSNQDSSFASYAIVSGDYLNLNMRFGYHFAILDCLCGPIAEENYIMLRFAGGGGNFSGVTLRLYFISEILKRHGFSIITKGDLLDGRLLRYNEFIIEERLDMVGRLLGATKLMDMILTDENMALSMVEEFMNGKYDFSV
ncbi:MAG: PEP/pyruvate-binding domain-containing protein [Pseudomonadota bacterium]